MGLRVQVCVWDRCVRNMCTGGCMGSSAVECLRLGVGGMYVSGCMGPVCGEDRAN